MLATQKTQTTKKSPYYPLYIYLYCVCVLYTCVYTRGLHILNKNILFLKYFRFFVVFVVLLVNIDSLAQRNFF
jgi:hypothetical protein